jgi:TonB family protein
MFTSTTIHNHNGKAQERRACHRSLLNWAVLVSFEQNNWGKLIDVSEKGMSFQFAHPPSLRKPIAFTFEAMGCMPIPHDGKIFGDSIQATGQVVWSREFERTAGVQFLELSARSRDQIRYWISSVTSQDPVLPNEELDNEWNEGGNKADQEEPAPFAPAPFAPAPFAPAPFAPAPFAPAEAADSSGKTPSEFPEEASENDLEDRDPDNEALWESQPPIAPKSLEPPASDAKLPREPRPEPTFAPASLDEPATSAKRWPLEPKPEPVSEAQELGPIASEKESFWEREPEVAAQRVESLAFELPGIPQHEERQERGQTLELKQQRARIGYAAMLGFLATLGAVAGIIGFTSKFSERAEGTEGVSRPLQSKVNSNQMESPIAAEHTSPFLVEVLDANNRRSVLWFSAGAHSNSSRHLTQNPSLAASVGSKQAARKEKAAAPEGREPLRDFSLVPAHASSPGTNPSTASSVALEAPAFSKGLPASLDVPLQETLPSPAMLAHVEQSVRQGGDVQPARLIRATLPVYPQVAKVNRTAGDVTLDALVDASGNVRDVQVISGPVLLREAARAALRDWKYEPARLDGQPTAMHLTVTVKFRNNQDNQ